MSAFAAISVYNKESDWLLALAGLFVAYAILYPLYILYLRYSHSKIIKRQLVTSIYKLPISLSPTELAYVFSTKVGRPQMLATLFDLANRSVVVLHDKHGIVTVESGPKVDNNLSSYEKLLMEQISDRTSPVAVRIVMEGSTSRRVPSTRQPINGTKHYVFWWLLRENLRVRGIMQRDMSKRYAAMLVSFGALGSLFVCVIVVVTARFMQMIDGGEVDAGRLLDSMRSSVLLWLMMLIPMLFISFGLLKFRGKMLGRDWVMTKKYRRYLGQIDAFREFVRMTHKGNLKFESKELYTESLAITRPYAIACGYIKK
jgi:uncharacterized membrane protein